MEARLKKAFYEQKDKVPNLEEFIKRTENFAGRTEATKYYNEQEIVQLHKLPNPKYKLTNHYNITIPNQRHEVDLIYVTHDYEKVGRRNVEYHLIFMLIDVATRYKAARPVKDKTAAECMKALKDIYDNDEYLDHPQYLYTDAGNEFKGVFHKFVEKLPLDTYLMHSCNTDRTTTKHIQTQPLHHLYFVERFNGVLAKEIFKVQQFKELATAKANAQWLKQLQPLVETLNATKTRMIHCTPIEAMHMEKVPQEENHITEEDASKRWPDGTLVRYLLAKDEIVWTDANSKEKKTKRRLTDILWSIDLYRVSFSFRSCEKCLWLHGLIGINGAKDNDRMYNYWSLQEVSE